MIILLTMFTLMIICTVSVIAAGMLSSRISEQEHQVEVYEIAEKVSLDTEPVRFKEDIGQSKYRA